MRTPWLRIIRLWLFGYVALAASSVALADLGGPDPTFGSNGVVTEPSPPCNSLNCPYTQFLLVQAVAQPDGKILVLALYGRSLNPDDYPWSVVMRVTRKHANGAPDSDFGNSGFVSLFHSVQTGQDMAQLDGRMTLQPDGKILVAARLDTSCPSVFCPTQTALARLNSNGSLDGSFGSAGMVVNASGGKVFGLGVQADGRILVATRKQGFKVLRFLASGDLDTSYGNAGVAVFPVPDDGNPWPSVGFVFHADGRSAMCARPGPTLFARLTASGQADTGFNGTGGLIYSTFISVVGASLTFQDDRLLVAGALAGSVLIRILPDGTPDPSFGTGGVRTYADGLQPADLEMSQEGKIVGSGTRAGGVALMRWLPNGDDDPSLGSGGRLYYPSLPGTGVSLQLLPNTKAIALVGNSLVRFGANALQDNREFVLQQYRDFLGREGDAGGVLFWTTELLRGTTTRAQVAERFITSAEFQSVIAPIARLYFAYFLRYADYPGLSFWLNISRASNSLESISQQFASGAEFNLRYGSLSNSQFVERVYANVLGRAPDSQGFAFWVNQLNSGARTRGQVMLAFSEGAEFRALSQNEVYVTMIYAGMLRREPDAGGFAFWVDYMDQGNSSLALIQGFLDGPEYRARFAP